MESTTTTNVTTPPSSPRIPNRMPILILQHPQEPGHALGTAELTARVLENATLRIGLSWPNLARAWRGKTAARVGENAPSGPAPIAVEVVDAKRWGVLYLGGKLENPPKTPGLYRVVKSKTQPVDTQPLDGLVVLDGTWSQAKTLWWRNAWLLKLQRLILNPARPSLYGKKRREPRRECLSTIESIGSALTALGGDPALEAALLAEFQRFLG